MIIYWLFINYLLIIYLLFIYYLLLLIFIELNLLDGDLVGVVGGFGIDDGIGTAAGVTLRTVRSWTSHDGWLQRQIVIQLEELVDSADVNPSGGRVDRQVPEASSAAGRMTFIPDGRGRPVELVYHAGVGDAFHATAAAAAAGADAWHRRQIAVAGAAARADGRVRKSGGGDRQQRQEEQRPAHSCGGVATIVAGRNLQARKVHRGIVTSSSPSFLSI